MERDTKFEKLDSAVYNIGYYLSRDVSPARGFPVRYFISYYLDDPQRKIPLCKVKSTAGVSWRIRFALSPFPLDDEAAEQHGYTLLEIIRGDVPDKDEDLVNLLYDFYPYLTMQIPALNEVSYEELYKEYTGMEAPHANTFAYHKYLDVFTEAMWRNDGDGHYYIGTERFKKRGDVLVDSEVLDRWKEVFVSHFKLGAFPDILYDIQFKMVKTSKFDRDRFSVTVYYATDGLKKYRSMAIRPSKGEEFAALTYLMASILRGVGCLDTTRKYDKCFFCKKENPNHPGRICPKNPKNFKVLFQV